MKQKNIFACLLMVILSACSSNGNTSNSTNDISTQSATSSKVEQANNSIGNDNHIFTPEIEQSIPVDDFFRFYITDFPEYEYNGEIEKVFDDRTFVLEDTPENIVEELAVNNFYFDIAGEHDKLAEIMGENETLTISLESEKKHFDEGIYLITNIIHDVSIFTVDDFDQTIDWFKNKVKEDVEEFGLIEYSVARVDITWEHSEASLAMGPQIGDGRYERLYLCGKTDTSSEWKIYEVFWNVYI